MRNLLRLVTALTLFLITGCGGSFVNGRFLEPPAASESLVTFARMRGLPSEIESNFITPVQVRVYPKRYIVVDVVVVLTAESAVLSGWVGEHGTPPSVVERVSWVGRYFTNGIMNSRHYPIVRVSTKGGKEVLRLTRPIVQSVIDEPEWESFGFGTRPNVAVVPFEHVGVKYWGCVVPIVLATELPPKAGDLVTVQLVGERYNVDSRAYELETVEAPMRVAPNESATVQSPALP